MVNTKYLNAKNGIEILHDDNTTQVLAGPGDPSFVGQEANIGSIFMRSSLPAGLYTKVGISDLDWNLIGTEQLTIDQYLALDDRSKFTELHRSGNKVIQVDEWTSEDKIIMISSTTIQRLNNKVTGTIKSIYDYATGSNVIATIFGIINRDNNKIQSISYLRVNE